MSHQIRRVAAAAGIGTTLEWYDFFLYGTASALFFPTLFFPHDDPLSGTLLSFGVYATGFAARPLGGILFGHLGDRIGRRNVLFATLALMGVATVGIGLLPTYSQIGATAPILLVALRIVQGLGTGGEWGGAALLTKEHGRGNKNVGFWGAFLSSAVFIGLVIGSVAYTLLAHLLTHQQLMDWGWRIPFLLSVILVAAGVYTRLRIEESPEFDQTKREGKRAKVPVLEALRHPRNIIAIFFMRIGENTTFYVVAVFALVYVTKSLGMSTSLILTATVIAASSAAVLAPVWGYLGDRIGFRKVMVGALAFQAVFAFPFFSMLHTRNETLVIIAIVIMMAGCGAAIDAIQPAYFTTMFGTNVRYSGVSIGREGGTAIGGGLPPLIATAMLGWGHGPWPIAWMMAGTSIVGLGAAYLARGAAEEEPATATAGATTSYAGAAEPDVGRLAS